MKTFSLERSCGAQSPFCTPLQGLKVQTSVSNVVANDANRAAAKWSEALVAGFGSKARTKENTVIKLIKVAFAAAAIAFTAGCATHGKSVALGVEAPYVGYPYDGYYDGFYGPYLSGYWGADGFFYYGDGHGRYHRDDGHHFSHEALGGFHGVHTAGGHFGGGGFHGGGGRFGAGGFAHGGAGFGGGGGHRGGGRR